MTCIKIDSICQCVCSLMTHVRKNVLRPAVKLLTCSSQCTLTSAVGCQSSHTLRHMTYMTYMTYRRMWPVFKGDVCTWIVNGVNTRKNILTFDGCQSKQLLSLSKLKWHAAFFNKIMCMDGYMYSSISQAKLHNTWQRQSLNVPFGKKFLTVMTPSELHDVKDGGYM